MPNGDDNVVDFSDARAQQAWRTRLAMDADADPENAARAADLAQITGQNDEQVYNNLDNVEKGAKVELGQRVVQASPEMQQWILEHNSATKMANDDYGNLHTAGQSYENLSTAQGIPWGFQSEAIITKHLRSSTGTMVRALAREFGSSTMAGYGQQLQRSAEDIALTPEQQSGVINGFLGTLGDIGPQVGVGIAAGLTAAAVGPEAVGAAGIGYGVQALLGGLQTGETMAEAAEQKGKPSESAYNLGFVIGTLFNYAPIPMVNWVKGAIPGLVTRIGTGAVANTALAQVQQLLQTEAARWTYDPHADFHVPGRDELMTNFLSNAVFGGAFEGALMYMRAGKPLPHGVDPLTDRILSERDAAFDKQLDQVIKDAGTTNLSERGEQGKKLLSAYLGKFPEATESFDADAVLKLYGDKPPAPDDGLFGFLPDIEQQLKGAANNGTPIRVPLNELAARAKDINPEAWKALEQSRHLDPMGLSAEDVNNIVQQGQVAAQQQQELLTTPDKEAYFGGLTDSGSRALDTVRRVNGIDGILPVPPDFWSDFGKGILNQPDRFPLQNVGGKTSLMQFRGSKRGQMADIKSLGDTTGADLLSRMDYSKWPGFTRTMATFFRDRITKLAGDTPITIVADSNMKRLVGSDRTAGYYDPNTHHIVIKESIANGSKGDHFLAHVVIHEMSHAASVREILANPELAQTSLDLMNDYRNWIKNNEPDLMNNPMIAYAFTGEHRGAEDATEFIAQAQSSPEVEATLHRAQMSVGTRASLHPSRSSSLWEGAKQLFRKALEKVTGEQIPDSIMDGIFDWGDLLQQHHEGKTVRGVPPTAPPPRPPGEPPEPPIPPTPPEPTPEEMELFQNQRVLGYSKETWDKIKPGLIEQREKDRQFMRERLLDQARQQATQEWKDNEKIEAVNAADRVMGRPEIAADRFLRDGILNGRKVVARKLDWNKLTPDQRDALGRDYWVRSGGVDPNQVFPLFGYLTPDDMISGLSSLKHQRDLEGLTPNAFFANEVRKETERLMKAKYGSPEDKVLELANDHIHNEGQLNLLHQDTLRIMMKYGSEAPITLESFKNDSIRDLEDTLVKGLKPEHLSTQNYNIGKKIERAALAGDRVEEIRLAQQRERTFIQTGYMREWEKLGDQASRIFDSHIARQNAKFNTQETAALHNYIQLFARQLGKRVVPRTDELLAELKAKGYDNFGDFVDKMESDHGIMVAIPDFLRDWDFNRRLSLKDWKIGEAKSMFEAVKQMHKEGLDENKVNIRNEKLNMEPILSGMKEQMNKWSRLETPETKTKWQNLIQYAQSWDASLRIPERLFDRWDGNDPRGLFNQIFSRGYTEAANFDERLRREWKGVWQNNKQPKRFDTYITAPPMLHNFDGTPVHGFTGENLYSIALNMGNQSSWFKFVKTHGLGTPDSPGAKALEAWVQTTMRPDEWEYVNNIWKFFKTYPKPLLDQVYRSIYGNAPGTVQARPIDFIDKDGVAHHFDGGYYPLMKDGRAVGPGSRTATFKVEGSNDNWRELTANPHAQDRTEATNYIVTMSMKGLPSRIYQMAHDIAFREHLVAANKFLGDSGLHNAISTHYGNEYWKAIESHYQRIADGGNPNQAANNLAEKASEFARKNVLSFYIGGNIFTALKHGPTAAINSLRILGPEYMARGMKVFFGQDPTASDSAWRLVHSFEGIQRRDREFDTRFGLQPNDFTKSTLRDYVIHYGAYPVMLSDKISSTPLAYGAWLKALDEGQSPGEARFEAERAVRFAHGDTASTNLPSAATGGSLTKWMASFYHFWGTMLQNRVHIMEELHDMYKDNQEFMESGGKDFDKLKAVYGAIPIIAADVFAYVIWPAMVEEWVTGLWHDERRGFGERLGWYTIGGLMNSFLYARDIYQSLESGRDSVGLFSGVLKPLHDSLHEAQELNKEGLKAFHNPKFAGNLIRDILELTNYKWGTPLSVANAAKYGYNWGTGVERPRTGLFKSWFQLGDVGQGFTRGEQKQRVVK